MLYCIIYIRRGESFGLSDKSNPAYFWKKASPFHRSKTFQRVALTTFGTLMNINIAGRWMPHAPQNLIDRYIDPYVYIYIYTYWLGGPKMLVPQIIHFITILREIRIQFLFAVPPWLNSHTFDRWGLVSWGILFLVWWISPFGPALWERVQRWCYSCEDLQDNPIYNYIYIIINYIIIIIYVLYYIQIWL